MKPSKNYETDLDSEAARRALDYYLNPNPPRPTLDNRIWTLHEGVTGDQAQEHAIALLRCAALRPPPRKPLHTSTAASAN